MSGKLSGIYAVKLTRPNGQTSFYVGQSINLKKRMYAHKYLLRGGQHTNKHLQSAWDAYGEGAFQFLVIESDIPPDVLTDREEYWIAEKSARHENGGFNQRIVADSCRGLKKSAESVERSASANRGRHLSDETKAAIGRANKGRKPTRECIEAALAARRGKPPPRLGMRLSEESRAKISETKCAAARAIYGVDRLGEYVPSGGNHCSRNGAKTHCKHGHPFTVENTHITKHGTRTCRVCMRLWQRAYHRKLRGESAANDNAQIAREAA